MSSDPCCGTKEGTRCWFNLDVCGILPFELGECALFYVFFFLSVHILFLLDYSVEMCYFQYYSEFTSKVSSLPSFMFSVFDGSNISYEMYYLFSLFIQVAFLILEVFHRMHPIFRTHQKMKSYCIVQNVMRINLLVLIIVLSVTVVLSEWIIIVHGSIIALDLRI